MALHKAPAAFLATRIPGCQSKSMYGCKRHYFGLPTEYRCDMGSERMRSAKQRMKGRTLTIPLGTAPAIGFEARVEVL
jgi:hypothetical protein